ncbi:SEC14-like protein 5 isoform X2 [Apostichopus japonicus]|uniref:SEC14-like protein 5 isoform X2 n=1 Tax=Stichopus japonicus TaxID=307972 RepID=UPI003AB19AD2
MVQKYHSPVRIYKHPFEMVMAAYERRFPTCPMIPIFLGSDITEEEKSEDGAIHIITRRCRLNLDAPYILKRISGVEHLIFIQRNSYNWRQRTLKIEAWNESFNSRVHVLEGCTYTVHPDNSSWTCFEQTASLEIKSFFGFESTVEKLAVKQYAASLKKSNESQNNLSAVSSASPMNKLASSSVQEKEGAVGGPQEADEGTLVDEDYIKNFLGDLTPIQESKLITLREWLSETHKGKMPHDAHLLRFLRARDFNTEKAHEMITASLAWRKQHQVDKILKNWEPPDMLQKYFPGSWHYHDRDGRPLFIMRLGQLDVKGLLKAFGEEGILRYVLTINEEGLRRTEEATRKYGKPISSWTCVADCEGLSMRHLWRPGIKALLRMIEVVEANYPETMGRLLIVRAPRVFPVIWTFVSPFIDENTRKKFLIYGGKNYMEAGGLPDYVEPSYIPEFLGGDNYCEIPDGGIIPKSFYRSAEEIYSPDELPLCSETVYKLSILQKGVPHEVLVHVTEAQQVLTWDFDVLRGDVTFAVLFSKRPLTVLKEVNHAITSHHPAQGVSNTIVFDKSMVCGVNYNFVEQPLVCKAGESMQGSHICQAAGWYVLQWKYYQSVPSMNRDQKVSHHNKVAKVIYYQEVLASDDFRGSMSSLQSCQSGFSSLSISTTSSKHSQSSSHSSSQISR